MISIVKYLSEGDWAERALDFISPAKRALKAGAASAADRSPAGTVVNAIHTTNVPANDPSNNAILNAAKKTQVGSTFGRRVPEGL